MSAEPQSCTKCRSLPEDILMLACNHDLCLDCAAERLSAESKKKTATGITCEFCNERTQLDAESIYELEKIMLDIQSRRNKRDFKQPTPKRSEPEPKRLDKYDRLQKRTDYNMDIKPPASYSDYPSYKEASKSPLGSSAFVERKNCLQHPQEQIMYYCFECNSECICPECVIHGKHKNHDVKTLRKSQPIIKGRLESMLESIDSNVDGLAMKKSEFEKNIKEATEVNNASKKQIQKVFSDLRQRIASKENEVLAKCDKALEMTVEEYERGIKAVVKKINDIRQSSQSVVDTLKRDELTLLNFYARKNQSLVELVKKVDLGSFIKEDADRILSNQSTIKFVTVMIDKIGELDIDSSIKYEPRYDQPRSASRFGGGGDYDGDQEYQRPARDIAEKARIV